MRKNVPSIDCGCFSGSVQPARVKNTRILIGNITIIDARFLRGNLSNTISIAVIPFGN